ncbi:MAG: LON peptidase substrate-binding domain-containing protein [Caldimonas sp.]
MSASSSAEAEAGGDPSGAIHDELPLFPLSTVLFPDGLLELKIFEARYLDLMSRCMRERRPFGVVALRSGNEAKVSDVPVTLHNAGTLAELIEVDSAQAGILLVRARGTQRFLLDSPRQKIDGLWVGRARMLPADDVRAPAPAHEDIVRNLAAAVATLAAQGAAPFLEPHRFDDAGWVANRWCEILPIPVEAKLRLMMFADPLGRLDIVDSSMRGQSPVH